MKEKEYGPLFGDIPLVEGDEIPPHLLGIFDQRNIEEDIIEYGLEEAISRAEARKKDGEKTD